MVDLEDQTESLKNSENVNCYQIAAEIANRALAAIISACVEGSKVHEICALGDNFITEACAKTYKKERNGKKVPKGIAFPTTLNINHVICHYAPGPNDALVTLRKKDMVKIELGVHIDGFPAMVGHTLVVGATKEDPVTGKLADIMQAAHLASEASIRLLRPGKTNFDITNVVQKVVKDEFSCIPVEGMLSSRLRRTYLDDYENKSIVMNPSESQKREFSVCNFELGEVYAVDVLVSTSADGKARLSSKARTSIYKRIPDEHYQLRMQSSRKTFAEISRKFGYMPFNVTAFEDEKKARMGIVECVKHELLLPYEVMEEREGEFVAQFMYTALLMPNGNILKITSAPFDQSLVKSDKTLTDDSLKSLISESLKATS